MDGLVAWSPGMTLDAWERICVEKAYAHFRHNKTATANALGIAIRTLDSKLEKYAVDNADAREASDSERQRRIDFLARQRGNVPDHYGNNVTPIVAAAAFSGEAETGLHVESAALASAEPAVSLSQREKVQEVLPGKATKGGDGKRRVGFY